MTFTDDTASQLTLDPVQRTLDRFPYQLNPHVEQARTHLTGWVRDTGLVLREQARARFDHADFGWFASMVYPTADPAHAELMADWFAWLFLVDDQLDDGADGRSPQHLAEVMAAMRRVLSADDFGAADARRRDLPRAVSSLADLWRRTAPDATARWRRLFVRHLEQCLTTAATWEAGNRLSGIVPDEATYIEKRRHTGAIYVCMDFIDVVERIDMPDEVYDSAPFRTALDAACNVVCWTNDIYSLDKERALGEVHNLAYIVGYHHGLDRDAAVHRVTRAIDAETDLYLAAEAQLRRTFPGRAAVLEPYLAGMRSWMRGNVDWSSRTKRYQPTQTTTEPAPQEYLEATLLGSQG